MATNDPLLNERATLNIDFEQKPHKPERSSHTSGPLLITGACSHECLLCLEAVFNFFDHDTQHLSKRVPFIHFILASTMHRFRKKKPSSSAGPTNTPAPTVSAPGSSTESSWGTAYQAAKIAIDLADASSDMFFPLKAVVGALSVLIKNYDVRFPKRLIRLGVDYFLKQNADNTDQMREIEQRIRPLREPLESPVGDQDDEEKARRDALKEFVLTFLRRKLAHF